MFTLGKVSDSYGIWESRTNGCRARRFDTSAREKNFIPYIWTRKEWFMYSLHECLLSIHPVGRQILWNIELHNREFFIKLLSRSQDKFLEGGRKRWTVDGFLIVIKICIIVQIFFSLSSFRIGTWEKFFQSPKESVVTKKIYLPSFRGIIKPFESAYIFLLENQRIIRIKIINLSCLSLSLLLFASKIVNLSVELDNILRSWTVICSAPHWYIYFSSGK